MGTQMNKSRLYSEIAEQVEMLSLLTTPNDRAWATLSRTRFSESRYAIIAARGTSDNVARYAKYVWGARNKLPVALAAPSLYGIYGTPPILDDALVVGISQSGESPDLVSVLKEGQSQGRPTVAITNKPSSPLARTAELVVDLRAGNERSVAATKTYTAQLAAVAMASKAMRGENVNNGHPRVLKAVSDVLESEQSIIAAVDSMPDADRCVVLGRGFHYATAHEWALKIQELTYMFAHPYSSADFRHGPLAMVDRSVPVLIAASVGPLFDSIAQLATELHDYGMFVVGLSDSLDFPCDVRIHLPKVEEWLAPIVAAPAVQLFAYHLALHRGLNPDSPRRISKITRTN